MGAGIGTFVRRWRRTAMTSLVSSPIINRQRIFGDDSGGINRRALTLYDRLVFPLSQLGDMALSPLLRKNAILTAVRS
jgi:hypothetical protein